MQRLYGKVFEQQGFMVIKRFKHTQFGDLKFIFLFSKQWDRKSALWYTPPRYGESVCNECFRCFDGSGCFWTEWISLK